MIFNEMERYDVLRLTILKLAVAMVFHTTQASGAVAGVWHSTRITNFAAPSM